MTPPAATQGKAYFFGNPDLTFSWEPRDKLGVALDKLMGLNAAKLERSSDAAVFSDRHQNRLWIDHRRMAEAHRAMPLMMARSFEEVAAALPGGLMGAGTARVREAQSSSDFPNLLGETMHRLMLTAYAEGVYSEDSLFRPVRANDLRDQRGVNVSGVPDLPVLDAESQGYPEMTRLTESVLSYPMLQRGTICTITRRVLINNDVDLVQRFVEGLGRAARRTLARRCGGCGPRTRRMAGTRCPGSTPRGTMCRAPRSRRPR